ncbi:olfactory receptor 2AP1-like [Pelodytes ibericus]
MFTHNQTEFILLGFMLSTQIQKYVFVALMLVYILSLLGNLLIIAAICLDQHLQTPMYFFLSSLAFMDIFFISTTAPKLLSILAIDNRTISQSDCLLQFYFYVSFGGTEFCLLALMSFDRYLAICHPLRYSTIMTHHFCWKLIISSWIVGFLEFIPTVYLISQFDWCGRQSFINHFFCDGSALLHASCSDTYVAELMIFWLASFAILGSLISSLSSYCCILLSIFKLSSSKSRNKTFSTCSSHLLVLLISYGSCIFIYVRPAGSTPASTEKTVAVFNSILGPCLNPFIYTLRNHMVKKTVRDLCRLKQTDH